MLVATTKIDRASVWSILVLLTLCAFPLYERSSTIGIVLLIAHFLFDKKLLQKVKSIRFNLPVIIGMVFFAFHFVALLWSSHTASGWPSIEVKMSMVILPVLFAGEHYLNKQSLRTMMPYFIVSSLVVFFYGFICSVIKYADLGIHAVFHRMNVAEAIMHPGYFSNYLIVGLIFICYEIWINKSKAPSYNYALLACLLFALFVLISKTAIFAGICFAVYLLWKITRVVKNIFLRIGSFICLIVVAAVLLYFIPPINSRLHEMSSEGKVDIKNPSYRNSTVARRAAYELEFDLVKGNFILGYGTGSANYLLMQKFREKGYTDLIKYNMHTHQQLLHTWIDLGLLGLLLLLAFIVSCFWMFCRKKNGLGAWITILLFLNMLTDDALEIQAIGVFCLYFIYLLLFMQNKKKKRYHYITR